MNHFPASLKRRDLFTRITNRLSVLPLVHVPSGGDSALITELRGLSAKDLFGQRVQDESMAEATRAGLFLVLEAWEEAHHIAQDLDTAEGSYWHGIVHRREPDPSNAKYWFRQFGNHPVFVDLWKSLGHAQGSSSSIFNEMKNAGRWDPFLFIDWCMASERGERANLRPELQGLQHREMEWLLTHCANQAVGTSIAKGT